MTTRDRIVDAAAAVMRQRGLARATTKEIAREAGLSEAALYKHFPGKAALLESVVQERLPELVGTLKQLPERAGQSTVAANLEELVAVAVAFYRELVPMAGSLFADPDLLVRHQQMLRERGLGPHLAIGALAAYLEAEQRQGRVDPQVDPHAGAALLLGGCLQRAFFATFVGPYSVDGDDPGFAVRIVADLLRGIAPNGR